MNEYLDRVRKTRVQLNAVGPGFCLMKWMTVTLYLHQGDNHSCYHPRPHYIKPEDIETNPSGLHNTHHKKLQRKTMLEGGRPSECYYCWNVEDMPGDHVSDRMIHSSSEYAISELERIKNLPWNADINPRHIEVSFGNTCNFKCGYCCPQASSSWMSEMKQFGDYEITSKSQYSIDFLKSRQFYNADDPNPYVDAFWKWWPTLKKDLRVFRITGGEPLINPNTHLLLDKLENDPETESLELHCNSNMGMSNQIVSRFSNRVNKLLQNKRIKDFRLFTSIDTWGKKAEYIRHGLNCELWEKNLRTYLSTVENSKVNFMCTFNILSVTSFKALLEKILAWREEFGSLDDEGQYQRIQFDTPYLKEPRHFMMFILPRSFKVHFEECLDFMQTHGRNQERKHGFDRLEIEKFKRLMNLFLEQPFDLVHTHAGLRDFAKFFDEHDRRRGSNFLATFPEYAEFYQSCKNIREEIQTSAPL